MVELPPGSAASSTPPAAPLPPFEPLDLRLATFEEFETALRAAVETVFPAGRSDAHPLYTVRASRCQFRNGADVIPGDDGELLRDENGNYAYSTPLYKWICTIGGSAAFAAKGSAEDRFASTGELLQKVLGLVHKTPAWQFWEKCDSGYDATFTKEQGTVTMGYRISTTRDKHGVVLMHLSLCHLRVAKK
ncbi:MAG TPA: hypothetical protein VL860_08575 [Planctomycetota bacterium]|nr:hypothetical protein [Planctomycetota bacterium]